MATERDPDAQERLNALLRAVEVAYASVEGTGVIKGIRSTRQASRGLIARRSTPLWLVTKPGEKWTAELRPHHRAGWELQLLRNGAFRFSRWHQRKAEALAEATERRSELEAHGWKVPVRLIPYPTASRAESPVPGW